MKEPGVSPDQAKSLPAAVVDSAFDKILTLGLHIGIRIEDLQHGHLVRPLPREVIPHMARIVGGEASLSDEPLADYIGLHQVVRSNGASVAEGQRPGGDWAERSPDTPRTGWC